MPGNRADIRAIKDATDIHAVISRYVSLSKSGSGFKGRCPFHKDDTPSMTVSTEKGLWHCFGCGEGGDVIAFLMKIERLTFVEAAKRLAEEAGIPFHGTEDGERAKLREIVADVANQFVRNLRSSAGLRAREYLLGRGYGEESWQRYGLGFALPGWDNVKKQFGPKHGERTLLELGLLVEGDKGTYDRFRDRTIFPILDASGRPIAFGGRSFEGDPKYLNSPKTTLFDKGRLLYGLSWAREGLAQRRSAVLVEGYTDVITLHEAGLTNTVGSMGTALTQGQAELLGRFVDEVVIAYDQDAAGGAASLRGMQILRNSGLGVRVAQMPVGEDPDGLVRSGGAQAMEEVVEAAVPFHRFFIDALAASHDVESVVGKERLIDDAREFYRGIRSQTLRVEIERQIADLVDLPIESVRRELPRRPDVHWTDEEAERDASILGPEETALSLVLRGDIPWNQLFESFDPSDFSEANRPIAEALQKGAGDLAGLVDVLDDESARRASYYALAPVSYGDTERAFNEAVMRLTSLPRLERELQELTTQLAESESAGDTERWNELMKRKVALRLARKGRNGDQGEEERVEDDRQGEDGQEAEGRHEDGSGGEA